MLPTDSFAIFIKSFILKESKLLTIAVLYRGAIVIANTFNMKTSDPMFPVTEETIAVCGVKHKDIFNEKAFTPEFFRSLSVEGVKITLSENKHYKIKFLYDEEISYEILPSQCMKINRNKRYQY